MSRACSATRNVLKKCTTWLLCIADLLERFKSLQSNENMYQPPHIWFLLHTSLYKSSSMEKTHAQNIKNVCETLLHRLKIPYQIIETDPAFYNDCRAAAIERGIPLDGENSLGRFFHTGVDLAAMVYGHLEYETKIYVALWGATAAACEDTCNNDIDLLKNFCHRYVKGIKHGHPLVDAYDSLLQELPKYFEPFAAETLLQSGMEFFVGLVWEYELQKNPITRAKGFPVFMKNLAGLSRMCAMLIFPRNIPLRSYMEAIPDCMTYVNVINDIFSLYKEELANESINFVSTMAKSSGKTKIEVIQQLADETIETYNGVVSVLSDSPEALDAFQKFTRGYVYFHISNERYKIADLWAACAKEQPAILSCAESEPWSHVVTGGKQILASSAQVLGWIGLPGF